MQIASVYIDTTSTKVNQKQKTKKPNNVNVEGSALPYGYKERHILSNLLLGIMTHQKSWCILIYLFKS